MEKILLKPGAKFNFKEKLSKEQDAFPPSKKNDNPKMIVKVFDKVITFSLFMIFLGVPLFFTGLSFQGVVFEKQIYFYFWVLLALIAWAAKGVVAGKMKIRKTPLDIPIAFFWTAYLLATVFSVDRWHSFWGFFGDPSRGLMSVTAAVIAYYLILSNFNLTRFKWMLGALISSSAIISIWTTLGILGIQFLPGRMASIAPLSLIGSVSGLGTFFGLMIPILATAVFKINEGDGVKKIARITISFLLIFILAVNLFLLLSLYGFISWASILAGVSFFVIYILSRIVRPKENLFWIPLLAFVLIMTILMVGKVDIARVNFPVEVSPSRGLSWEIAKDSLKNNFLLGSGPATYGYDFSAFSPQEFNLNSFYQLRFYQGTGVFFESLSTLGAVGTIALVILILSFISVAVYLVSKDKEKNKIYSLGLLSATLVIIVSSFMIRTEGTILFLGVLIGILTIGILLEESDLKSSYVNLSLKASPKFALALAFIFVVVSAGAAFLFAFIGKAYVADIYAGLAVGEKQISEEGSIKKLGEAIRLYGNEGRYYLRIGQEYMVLANSEILKSEEERDMNKIQKYLNDSIRFSKKGAELMSNDVLAIETLAQVYENAGFYVSDSLSLSEEQYGRARDLEPRNPNFYFKLGQIKTRLAAGKSEEEIKQLFAEAKDLFQQSVDKKSNFAPGHYQLALTKEVLGETDGAIDSMTVAARLNPKDINYIFGLGRLYQARGNEDDAKIIEGLFKKALEINSEDINARFNLGLFYDKAKRGDEAIEQYEKVIELLPAGREESRRQLEKMISNIKSGIENTTETINPQAVEQTQNIPTETPVEESPQLVEPEPAQSSMGELQNSPNLPAEEASEPQPSNQ
ncbi:tetratricopeptide repeat protein [bacterium]|nr:tetratricopeptide repeat protein [bacterium]